MSVFCGPTASGASASERRKTASVARQGQIARETFFRGVEPEAGGTHSCSDAM